MWPSSLPRRPSGHANQPQVDDTLGWIYYKKGMTSLAVRSGGSRKRFPQGTRSTITPTRDGLHEGGVPGEGGGVAR